MVKNVALVALGFFAGLLYTSYVLDSNPNEVIKKAGEDAVEIKDKTVEAGKKTFEKVTNKKNSENTESEPVVE